MPQAYKVATGPAEARTSSPVAVSCSRGASPLPGSTGTSARRQDSMLARLSRGLDQATPHLRTTSSDARWVSVTRARIARHPATGPMFHRCGYNRPYVPSVRLGLGGGRRGVGLGDADGAR